MSGIFLYHSQPCSDPLACLVIPGRDLSPRFTVVITGTNHRPIIIQLLPCRCQRYELRSSSCATSTLLTEPTPQFLVNILGRLLCLHIQSPHWFFPIYHTLLTPTNVSCTLDINRYESTTHTSTRMSMSLGEAAPWMYLKQNHRVFPFLCIRHWDSLIFIPRSLKQDMVKAKTWPIIL